MPGPFTVPIVSDAERALRKAATRLLDAQRLVSPFTVRQTQARNQALLGAGKRALGAAERYVLSPFERNVAAPLRYFSPVSVSPPVPTGQQAPISPFTPALSPERVFGYRQAEPVGRLPTFQEASQVGQMGTGLNQLISDIAGPMSLIPGMGFTRLPRVLPGAVERAVGRPILPATRAAVARRPAGAATAKQPWEMTQAQTVESNLADTPASLKGRQREQHIEGVRRYHKAQVSRAIVTGKPVPAEVLKDYPDLLPPRAAAGPRVPTPPSEGAVVLSPAPVAGTGSNLGNANLRHLASLREAASTRLQLAEQRIRDAPAPSALKTVYGNPTPAAQRRVDALRADFEAKRSAHEEVKRLRASRREAGAEPRTTQEFIAQRSALPAEPVPVAAPPLAAQQEAAVLSTPTQAAPVARRPRAVRPAPEVPPEEPPAPAALPEEARPAEAVPPSFQPPQAPPPRVPPVATGAVPPEDFAANIRLSKYPEDLRATIRDWADTNPRAVQEARRGVRPDAQVLADARDLTEEMGGDFAKLQRRWKPGEAWNAEEVTAIRGVLREKTAAVVDAAKAARAADTTANQTRLLVALEEQARVQEMVHGVTAEAGRSLRAFRQEAFAAVSSGDNARMEELLRKLGGKAKTQEVADALAHLDLDNPYAVNSFIRNAMTPSAWDKVWFIFYNSILMGPKTHIINALSNMGVMTLSPAERALSAGVERGLARLQGRQVERFFAEVPADAFGAMDGMRGGFEAAASTLRYGISPTQASKWEYRTNPFKGKVGRVVGAPTTALEAADAFNREVNYSAALAAEIVRAAKKEGLRGTAYLERVAELKASPTVAMIAEANRIAEYRLFRQPLGSWASVAMNAKEKIPPLRLIIPFIRTPVNLLKFGIERSPLGIADPKLWRAIAQKSPEASDQIGRILLGSIIMGALAWKAAEGKMTGAVPKDAAARDRFYREGKQPFSVRIGDRWVQWQRLEPLNQTLTQLTAATEAIQAGDKDAEEKVGQVLLTVAQNFVSQTYVSSLSSLMDAMTQPERYGAQFLQRLATSFVPASAGLRTATQMVDRTIRRPKTIAESVQALIPGLSRNVPPTLTAFGQEAQRQSPAWSPIFVSPAQQSAVDAELGRLGVEVGFVGTSIGGVKLTREQQQQYQVLAGQRSYELLRQLVESSTYKGLDDAVKEKAINRAVDDARDYARFLIQAASAPSLTPQQGRQRRQYAVVGG